MWARVHRSAPLLRSATLPFCCRAHIIRYPPTAPAAAGLVTPGPALDWSRTVLSQVSSLAHKLVAFSDML